jgi:hypothetical protein
MVERGCEQSALADGQGSQDPYGCAAVRAHRLEHALLVGEGCPR